MRHQQFGPYRLDAVLGHGGMGEVYRAFDTKRGRAVALKLLIPELAADRRYEERFRRECRLAARLSSPHVIPIHDFGEIDGKLYLDMRLVDGVDLSDLVRRETALAPSRAVAIMRQVASALDAAHAEAMVHRDVKPANVVVSTGAGEHDFAYLVDFGIARSADTGGMGLTATGHLVGTLAYMAPELFAGEPPWMGVDIYALGCVLHECLTGRPPFHSLNAPALIHHHMSVPPPPASSLGSGIPPALDAVIATAMAKEPGQRYPTARAFADDARDALHATTSTSARARGRATSARDGAAGRPSAPGGWARALRGGSYRSVRFSADGRMVAATLAGAGGPVVWNARTGAPLRQATGTEDVPVVDFSPDGGRLAGGTNDDGGGEVIIWDLNGGRAGRGLARHSDDLTAVSFAPGAASVATGSSDGTAAVWEIRSGTRVRQYPHPGVVHGIAFSPDGGTLAAASAGGAWLWDVRARRSATPRATLHVGGVVHAVAFDPRGRTVAVAGGDGVVRSWPTSLGQEKSYAHEAEVLALAFSRDGRLLASADRDGTILFWAPEIGTRVGRHRIEEGGVQDLTFSPDDDHVVVIAWDGTAHVVRIRGIRGSIDRKKG